MAETPTYTLVQQRPAAIIATITQQRQSQLQQKEQKLTNTLYLYICVCVWIYTKSFFLTTINNCIVIFYMCFIYVYSRFVVYAPNTIFISHKNDTHQPTNTHTHTHLKYIHVQSVNLCVDGLYEKKGTRSNLLMCEQLFVIFIYFFTKTTTLPNTHTLTCMHDFEPNVSLWNVWMCELLTYYKTHCGFHIIR